MPAGELHDELLDLKWGNDKQRPFWSCGFEEAVDQSCGIGVTGGVVGRKTKQELLEGLLRALAHEMAYASIRYTQWPNPL